MVSRAQVVHFDDGRGSSHIVTLHHGGHPLSDLHCLASADALVPAPSFFSLLATYLSRGIKLDLQAFTWSNLGYKMKTQQRAQALAGQGWLVYNQDVDDVSGRAAAGLAEVVEQLRRQLRVKRNAKINANAQ